MAVEVIIRTRKAWFNAVHDLRSAATRMERFDAIMAASIATCFPLADGSIDREAWDELEYLHRKYCDVGESAGEPTAPDDG